MSFRSEGLHATGHRALDEHGAKLGKITDVLFTPDGEPEWAIVDPGPLKKPHFAPMMGAYETADGDVILPVEGSMLKRAPIADRAHILTPELEDELRSFYN